MSDKHILLTLLKQRREVTKAEIAKAIRSYSVTQRISEIRADVRPKGFDIPKPRSWKVRGRTHTAYRLVKTKAATA